MTLKSLKDIFLIISNLVKILSQVNLFLTESVDPFVNLSERSKELHSSCSVFALVGSNPTVDIRYNFIGKTIIISLLKPKGNARIV